MLRKAALPIVAALALGAAGCSDEVAPSEPPAQFVAVKRAWLPGERDSLIARIIRDRALSLLYVGDISDLAPQVFADPDSVVVVVPNPLYVSPQRRAVLGPSPSFDLLGARFSTGWTISGIDVHLEDQTQSPTLVLDWLGVFWSNPAEVTHHGFVIASATGTTTPGGNNIAVNTNNFDASGATTGAGGAEVRFHAPPDTSTIWQASSGDFRVTAASYPGGTQAVTSGPFTGGSQRGGSMQGRLRRVDMPRVLVDQTSWASVAPDSQTTIRVDFDFRGTSIPSLQLTCIFRNPGPACFATAAASRVSAGRAETAVTGALPRPWTVPGVGPH